MTTSELQTIARSLLMAVDESDVRAICGDAVLASAEATLARGITSPTRKGLELSAHFATDRGWPLQTRVSLGLGQVEAQCTCNSRQRFCGHVGALLLHWARSPGAFAETGPQHETYTIKRNWTRGRDGSPGSAGSGVEDEILPHLNGMRVADLRAVARGLGVRLRGGARSDLLDQLAAAYSDPACLERALGSLDADLRLPLAATYALASVDSQSAQRLKAALTRLLPEGVDGLAALRGLIARGLVYSWGGAALAGGFVVPSALWPYLPPVDLVERAPEPGSDVRPAGALATELLSAWSAVRDGRLALRPRPFELASPLARAYPETLGRDYVPEEVADHVRSGRWASDPVDLTMPRRDASLDNESLRSLADMVGGVERAELAAFLLSGLRLVEVGEVVSATEQPAYDLLWSSPAGRLRAALDVWRDHDGWNELDLALAADSRLRLRRSVTIQNALTYFVEHSHRADVDKSVAEGGRFILRVLSVLPEGVWLKTESLLDAVWRLWPDFLYGRQDYRAKQGWWLEVDGRRVDSAKLSEWAQGPGSIVLALVAGPLNWLGLADVAGPVGRPTAFRLRPEARLLRGAAVPSGESRAPIDLEPELVIRVASGYPDAELRELLSVAGRIEGASASGMRYRLKPEGARAAFEQGSTAESVLALLGARSESIPAELRTTVGRWWDRYGGLRLYEGLTLVELSDEQLLDELLAVSSLRRLIVHRLAPTLLAIDPVGAEDLFAELRARGYWPLRESLDVSDSRGGDDGEEVDA